MAGRGYSLPQPSACPSRITCGDTPSWQYRHPQYSPADGWVLTIYFSTAAESPKTCVAAPDPDGFHFVFALPAATTLGLIPGTVHYTIRAVSADGSNIATIAYGGVLVKFDPATAVDRRTYNEQCLADVQTAIQSRLQGTVMDEYVLGGVTMKMPALAKLQELKAFFQSEVRREQGGAVQRSIPIRLRPNRGGPVPFGFNRRPR